MSTPSREAAHENRELLADFGAVMVQIQLFEFTLLFLVNAQEDEPERRGSPEDYERIEELFTLPAGRLRRRAKIEDGELASLVERAIELRNSIVHRWLVLSAIQVGTGRSTVAAERGDLATAEAALRRVQIDLQAVFEQTLKDAGEELREPTLEEWRAMFGAPPPA